MEGEKASREAEEVGEDDGEAVPIVHHPHKSSSHINHTPCRDLHRTLNRILHRTTAETVAAGFASDDNSLPYLVYNKIFHKVIFLQEIVL